MVWHHLKNSQPVLKNWIWMGDCPGLEFCNRRKAGYKWHKKKVIGPESWQIKKVGSSKLEPAWVSRAHRCLLCDRQPLFGDAASLHMRSWCSNAELSASHSLLLILGGHNWLVLPTVCSCNNKKYICKIRHGWRSVGFTRFIWQCCHVGNCQYVAWRLYGKPWLIHKTFKLFEWFIFRSRKMEATYPKLTGRTLEPQWSDASKRC